MSPAMLSCQDLTVRFGGVCALDRVDFDAAEGAITSVIGPNGAGKTTLFNAVTGYVQASEGRVSLDGRELTGLAPHERSLAGVVRTFQNLEIFSNMSALENVLTGCHARVEYSLLDALVRTPRFFRQERRWRETAREMLDFAGLADKAGTPAGDLSFGSQRLLELARALAAGPKLLLLDEIAAGLNMRETLALGGLIRRIRDELGVTVVLVEHDMDLVMEISDRVFVLSFGRGIGQGSPSEVQRDPEVIAAYLGTEDKGEEGDEGDETRSRGEGA